MTTTKLKPSFPINQIVKEINWPLLASIAVHGIFFTTVFPRWYSQGNSVNVNSLSNTPIVELNSLEQTRLPNLNPSNSFHWDSLNPLPKVDNLNGLNALTIPLPPLENNSFDLPPMDNNVIYNDFAALPPPPVGMSDFSSIPPIPQTSFDFEASNTSPVDLPPPPPVNENSLEDLPPIPQEKFDEVTETNNLNTSSTFNQNMPVNQILDEERQAEIRRQLFANSPIEVTVNPRDVINNRDNKIDLRNESSGMMGNGLPSNLVTNFDNLSEKLAKNPENTSDEEARKNYVAWAQKVENVAPKEITLAGVYPKDACVKKLEGTTTYGVTVDSTGNVINSQLIKSSGYSVFNEQALRQISARQFENTSNGNVPYHVYVNFQYDTKICPSLSLSNLGNTPPSTPTNPTPSTPKPNSAITTSSPSPVSNPTIEKEKQNNSTTESTEKERQNKPITESVTPQSTTSESKAQPTRVNNLDTPKNSADTLKIPNDGAKNPVNQPKLPPIIESAPKKESEENIPSVRETVNSPVNSSEKKLDEKKNPDNETIMENNNENSSQKVDQVN